MTDSKLFLDSSIWLGYFLGNIPKTIDIIDCNDTILFTSIISLHEIIKKLRKTGRKANEINKAIRFIEENSIIVNLSKKIVVNAVNNCEKYGLHTIDGLIYSTAIETNSLFITADTNFGNAAKTRIIRIK